MTRKKKIMITVFSILGAVIIALSTVLITAAVMGKRLKVSPSRYLEGVSEEIQDILWYSSISANSHNSQAWTVKLHPDENKLQIAVDDKRTLAVVDATKREAYISLGCYIETMNTAFSAYGYETQIICNENTVELTYSKVQSIVNKDKLNLIDKRHTDKSAYSTKKINDTTANAFLAKYNGLHIYQNGEKDFAYLKQATLDAVMLQSADQNYRNELAEWLRFSDKEASEKLDGITAEMIGLKGIVKTFYYWTTSRESAKGDKFAQQGIDTAKKQVNNCGAFVIITGGNTFAELINTGRTTQAFWFDCAENNIAVQPLSAALETQPFSNSIQNDLGVTSPVQMILRLGYVDEYGNNLGLRRNLTDYIEVVK